MGEAERHPVSATEMDLRVEVGLVGVRVVVVVVVVVAVFSCCYYVCL